MNKQIMTIIKQARIDKGWSQYRLAKEAKIATSNISVYETLKEFPSYKRTASILKTLGIGIDQDKFVAALADYQKKHDFTMVQMGRILKLNLPQLYNVLNKKCEYSYRTICKMCKDLKLPLEDFLIKPKC
jgi:transcriptional regulator with XRE-family HTH domain